MSGARRITLEVLAEDIKTGKRCETRTCPVALALHRVEGVAVMDVGREAAHGLASEDGERTWRFVRVDFTEAVTEFVKAFDKGVAVKPFRCELDMVETT